MTRAQQFSLSSVWTGTEHLFTLPPQLRPFRVEAIFFKYTWAGGAGARNDFIRFFYGGSNPIWYVASQNQGAAGFAEFITASRDVGNWQVLNTNGVSPADHVALFPLPDLVLDELSRVEFGTQSTSSTDVATQGSIMIQFFDEPKPFGVPWWLGKRRKKN